MTIKQLFAVFFFFAISLQLGYGQLNSIEQNPFEVSVRSHYGYLAYHHPQMRLLQERHVSALEVAITMQSPENRKWAKGFGYPELGFVYMWFDLGSPTYLGQAFCLMPAINFTLNGRGPRSTFFFRMASGVGYVTKIFDRETNYKNTGTSNHINAAVNFLFEYRYTISPSLNLRGGLALSHLSNGSFKKPNAGLNLPTVYFGAGYRFSRNATFKSYFNADRLDTLQGKFSVIAYGGAKQENPIGTDRYPIGGISLEYTWRAKPFQRFGVGFDAMYNGACVENLKDVDESAHGVALTRLGVNFRYEFQVGRIGINLGIGPYLYGIDKTGGPLYERLALRYFFSEKLFGHVALKTHWGNADYVEYGLGIRL
ncbi:acyloxyacyl hydrolase [Williamwhitmania taraxaci]|uniref:Lipid A 3-O-deacylase (PagL) n=1 Tax=Williamwhitmania taraxaci TaxID=1640674 RepID=A0A1G6HVH5_9BACT|nr:acyloxyacyl hydrolase [Williamwhitmania taraxaci]SDB97476.1 Lipid A 3-O-deacylase (PagL) [Williamwhitmania taraxaci]